MKIIYSLKSVLNYILNYIANNFIPNIKVNRLTFSDNTYLETLPETAQLYDLKVLPEAISSKGWNCLNRSANRLSKNDVPTLYADILNKYNNVDVQQTDLQRGSVSSTGIAYFELNNYFYFCTYDNGNKNYKIYKSANADLSNPIEVFDLSTKITQGQNQDWKTTLFKNSNYIIATYGYQYGSSAPQTFFVFDLNFNYLGHKETPTNLSGGGFNGFFMNTTRFFDDNYFYYTYPSSNYSNKITRINVIDFVLNNADFEKIELPFSNYAYSGKSIELINNVLYGVLIENSHIVIYELDFENSQKTAIYTSTFTATVSPTIINNNNSILVITKGKTIVYENNNFVEKNNSGFPYDFRGIRCYSFVNNTLYLMIKDYMTTVIYTTTNFTEFTSLFSITGGYSDYYFCNILNTLQGFITVVDYRYFDYFGILKIEYTQTYNTKNHGEVTIKYYRYGNNRPWRICVPDETNDTNLDYVYADMGYLPYWRIDTANERVTPVKVKNKFTYMYVGDDYQDLENTLPIGLWERSALYSEITEKQDLLPTAQIGYFLSYDNNGLKWDFPKTAIQFETISDDNLLNGVEISFLNLTNHPSPKTTKSNGLATFTDIDGKTNYTIQLSKDGYITQENVYSTSFVFNFFTVEMLKVQATFTVVDEENTPLAGATVVMGDYTGTTNVQGNVTFEGILDGTYNYSISKQGFDTTTGQITFARVSQEISATVYPTPLDCLAKSTFAVDDVAKVNVGVGNSEYDFEAEAENSTNVNTLTLTGTARNSANEGELVQVRAKMSSSTIDVIADENDVELEFNNDNIIDTVNVNVTAISKFLCFVKGSDKLYFENSFKPFLPNVSNKAYTSTTYTYYTYDGETMTAHTATTSNANVGTNCFDGTTLIIDSADSYSTGTWTRSPSDDVNYDVGDAVIASQGYLTEINPVIPSTYKQLVVEALDRTVWKQILSVGGQKFENFPSGIKLWVKQGYGFSVTSTKINSNLAKDTTYLLFSSMSSDSYLKPFIFNLNTNVASCNIVLSVGNENISEVSFDSIGSSATIQSYKGKTIRWIVSKDGYVTQSGAYALAKGTSIDTYTQSVTLVATTVTITVKSGSTILSGATVVFDGQSYTTDANGHVVITGVLNGTYNITTSMTGYITQTDVITVAGNNVSKNVDLTAE